MAELEDLAPQLTKLLEELDRRAVKSARNNSYIEGTNPTPAAVESAKMTRAYQALMGMAQAPWASLVVDSVQDRLEVGGIETGDKDANERLWMAWRGNALDAESKLGHHGTLVDGRVFATIWPDATGEPEIVLDGADQVVVLYREGRHQPRHRIAALRRWVNDEDRTCVTLYTATALYKLIEVRTSDTSSDHVVAAGVKWQKREEIGRGNVPEPWPLPNPFNVVPVVEVATNRRLKPGPFPYARGEFEHAAGLIDRINLLTFLGLVVAVWMGFPLRGVIGDKILRDDDNNALAPFDSKPDEVVQLENPDAKVFQLDAADRKNLSIFAELGQLAYVTKTPAHYFPSDGGFSNISADTIRALEGGLHAKVDGIHKPQIGAGWEEVMRVTGLMMPSTIIVPATTRLMWTPREARSIAEAADAATKLKDILPWQVIAEKYLAFSQDDIRQADELGAGALINRMLDDAAAAPAADVTVAAA